MSNNLTGTTVSGTYGRLVQVVGGLYYDGNGNLLNLGGGTTSIGPQGPTGADGLQGPQGPTGADGANGSFNGDVATFSSIFATNSSFINMYIETGLTMSSYATINFDNGSFIGTGLTGINGIALNSENYEWRFENGEIFLYDIVNNFITIKDYAKSLPTVDDDITKGYIAGSYWRIDSQFYNCLDATEGAAVWVQVTNFGNLQQVTDVGNTTTNGVIINYDNGATVKSFKVNNTESNYTGELTSDALIMTTTNGVYSLFANGTIALADLNSSSASTVALNLINDKTSYGVGMILAGSEVQTDISFIYHPDYFVPQAPFNSPSTFYIPYKSEGIYTLATLDDISGLTGSYLPLAGGTMDADAGIFFANGSKISEGKQDRFIKGIALTCAVGYEWKLEAGEAYLTNLSYNIIELKQYARTIPLENDDVTKGFTSGSYWITLGGNIYQCTDPTEGAAVWVQETDFGTLQVVTDNGNVTTNQINIYSDTNGLFIKNDSELNDNLILAAESIITFNDGGIVRKSIIDNQTLVFTKDSISKTISAGTYNTDENTILILPDKASGSYTFAMIDDIPTKTSDLINDGEDGINPFITLEDLPVLSLDELTDVEITSPTNNQIPAYESATNLWKNKTIVEDAIVNGVIDKAPSQNAVFDALDLTRRLIVSNTGSTVTGTVAETILTSMVVSANTLDTVCDLFITLDYNKNTANAIPMKLYYNTSNSLAGATQISFYNTGSNRNGGFNRKFVVKGTSMDLITTVPTFTQLNNQFIDAIFAASTVITIAPTGNIYFIFTVANDAVGTTFINKRATVEKMKLS